MSKLPINPRRRLKLKEGIKSFECYCQLYIHIRICMHTYRFKAFMIQVHFPAILYLKFTSTCDLTIFG